MSKGEILNRLHGLGLNGQQAADVYYRIREQAVADIIIHVARFRETNAAPDATAVFVNRLMKSLREFRYRDELPADEIMRVVYIAHPIGGDVEANLADLRRIVAIVNREWPNVVPFAPYYADCVSLDDHNPDDRERGIRNDQFLIKSGILDEMWLTGPTLSAGMRAERLLAMNYGIPVLDKIGQL